MAQREATPVSALRDDLHFIWLRKWLVLGVVIAFTLIAFFVANSQTRMYEATARLMFQEQTDVSNPSGTGYTDLTGLSLQVQSVVNTINSPAVAERAAETLAGSTAPKTAYSVTATLVPPDGASGVSVSDVVAVTATSADPNAAAAVANAYAQAIIELRKENEQARLRKAQDAIRAQMSEFTSSASRLSSDYVLLAQRLQDLQVAEATLTGGFTIIQPASAPTSPSTPKPYRSAAIGFAVGLISGVALAWVLGQFDTRVRSHREVSEILGVTVVARMPRAPRAALKEGPLLSLTHPGGGIAESLRMLRSSLDWMSVDGDVKSLLFTSSVKGEGKTLIACNLAVTLALAGKEVVVVDADLRDPKVHTTFSLPNATGLSTVIFDSLKLDDALRSFDLQQHKELVLHRPASRPGGAPASRGVVRTAKTNQALPDAPRSGRLRILTSGPLPPNPGEVIASQRMATLLRHLAELEVDYVLVDAPPILAVGDAQALASSVDGLLYIANLEVARRPTLESGREALDALPCRILGAVVVGEQLETSRSYGSYGYVPPRPA